jgi:hypothetical protein
LVAAQVSLLCVFALALSGSGCARKIGGDPFAGIDGSVVDMDGGTSPYDGGRFGNMNTPPTQYDGGFIEGDLDATTSPDAFFINDPPPPYCGPDEDYEVPVPTGTPTCPGDKNREGCPCEEAGEEAPCWPGERVHRNLGICKDGVATCVDTQEFGRRWGACEGYVLPVAGATQGADACKCFSPGSGTWALSNLSPCISRNGGTFLYSSVLNAEDKLECTNTASGQPTVPSESWSTSKLDIACAGEFTLCFTIKAGDIDDPQADDCVVHAACQDVLYEVANVELELPDLPAWSSADSDCATDFLDNGGYGEMTVLGETFECDIVDDGNGEPFVFYRTSYCPASCNDTPDAEGCAQCRTGGSGDF